MNRIVLNIALIISMFLLPWWITILLCILGIVFFANFYESIIIFLILYGIYGYGDNGILRSKFYLPLILFVIFYTFSFIKKQFIFYQK